MRQEDEILSAMLKSPYVDNSAIELADETGRGIEHVKDMLANLEACNEVRETRRIGMTVMYQVV